MGLIIGILCPVGYRKLPMATIFIFFYFICIYTFLFTCSVSKGEIVNAEIGSLCKMIRAIICVCWFYIFFFFISVVGIYYWIKNSFSVSYKVHLPVSYRIYLPFLIGFITVS